MIYLVTANRELFTNNIYTIITVEESLNILQESIDSCEISKMLQLDTETTGLDPHIDKCLTLQLGTQDGKDQIVIDATTIDLKAYKEIIENNTMIGHNLKFDCQVLFNYGIVIHPSRCYDTMVVEQTLYLGFPNFMIGADESLIFEYCEAVDTCPNWDDLNSKEKASYLRITAPRVQEFISEHSGVSLKALCYRYLGMNISKEVRGQIIWRGLDTEVIKYAASDVTNLYKLREAQAIALKEKGLFLAAKVECEFVPCCAYYEYCGVHMNAPLWLEKMQKDNEKMTTALAKLNEYVVNYGDPKFYHINYDGDLFEGYDLTPKCTINWNSVQQVIPFLRKLGFNCRGIDKKTKEEKDSIDATVLKKQKDVNPEFYEIFAAYTEAKKVCSTYGQNYLNAVNPNTNRIHTTFRQLGTDTGRLACGSQTQNSSLAKLKKLPIKAPKETTLKCAYPQLQNLPADALTRACFCADKGNTWISIDYKGEESVLLADLSNDTAMLNVFLKGEDMHSTVAYMIFPDKIPRDTDIKDIKSKYKHLRQIAKGPEFCFAYGGNDSTLVSQYNMQPDEAKNIYESYMSGFSGISTFQNYQKKFVVNNGYILICPKTGHKAFWWDWKYWKKRQASFNSTFWDEYRTYHKGTGDNIAKKVSTHFKAKTKWEKNACNSPLQGLGAVIFKRFNTHLFNWIIENNYFNVVKFCIPVHDEINLEVPSELTETVTNKTQELMRTAAAAYLSTLTLDSDAEISDHWVH